MDKHIRQGELRGNPLYQYRSFRRDPIAFLANTQRLGDIVRIPTLMGKPSFIVHHPELIRSVLAMEDHRIIKGNAAKVLGLTLGEGLLTSEGEKHRDRRRKLQGAFRADMVANVSGDIVRLTDQRIKRWGDTSSRFVTQELMDLTLDIVFEGLFGISVGEDRQALHEIVEIAVAYSADRLMQSIPLPYRWPMHKNRRHRQAVEVLDGILERLLVTAAKTSEATVFRHIATLTDEGGNLISKREMRDHLVTFIIAGHETSANLLNWMVYALARHPLIQSKLYAEIDDRLGSAEPTFETIRDLTYLNQVMKETLRLYPPAWTIMRETVSPIAIDNVEIPARSTLIIVPYVMHRNARYFHDPEAFLPERFDPKAGSSWPQFAYIPFGAGNRTCIGNRLAQTEIALVMARMLQNYTWTIELEQPMPEPSISLRMKNGLRASFVPR